jgi:hypothetical protein
MRLHSSYCNVTQSVLLCSTSAHARCRCCCVIVQQTALQVALSGACPDKLRPAAVVSLTAALGEIGGPMLLTHAWAHALRATTTTAASTATAAGADAAAAAAAAFAYDARLPFSAAAAVCGVLYALTLVLHVNGVSSLAALLSGSSGGSSGSSSTGNSSSRSALEGVLEIPIRDFMSLVGAEHTVQEQTVKRS